MAKIPRGNFKGKNSFAHIEHTGINFESLSFVKTVIIFSIEKKGNKTGYLLLL